MEQITLTKPEVEKLLNYLKERPWIEVNELMVILLNKINQPKSEVKQ